MQNSSENEVKISQVSPSAITRLFRFWFSAYGSSLKMLHAARLLPTILKITAGVVLIKTVAVLGGLAVGSLAISSFVCYIMIRRDRANLKAKEVNLLKANEELLKKQIELENINKFIAKQEQENKYLLNQITSEENTLREKYRHILLEILQLYCSMNAPDLSINGCPKDDIEPAKLSSPSNNNNELNKILAFTDDTNHEETKKFIVKLTKFFNQETESITAKNLSSKQDDSIDTQVIPKFETNNLTTGAPSLNPTDDKQANSINSTKLPTPSKSINTTAEVTLIGVSTFWSVVSTYFTLQTFLLLFGVGLGILGGPLGLALVGGIALLATTAVAGAQFYRCKQIQKLDTKIRDTNIALQKIESEINNCKDKHQRLNEENKQYLATKIKLLELKVFGSKHTSAQTAHKTVFSENHSYEDGKAKISQSFQCLFSKKPNGTKHTTVGNDEQRKINTRSLSYSS